MPSQAQNKGRPVTSPALAFASQRVWHGGSHAHKSKLPAVITKDQHAVPPEVRRKRAVDAFFDQQQRAVEAKAKRELKPGGGGRGSGWNENPMQKFRLKHGIYDPEDGQSNYYLRASKEVHAVQLPSYKTDCPRNCNHCMLTSNPNEPGGAVHAPANTNSFFVEPLTRLMRDRWTAKENMRSQYIERHEATYGFRRLKDRSAQTLDNQYRQEMDPAKPNQTVMKSVLGGTFYDEAPAAAISRNSRTTRASSAMGGKVVNTTPNFVGMNKRNVRSASTVVHMCRMKGAL